MNKYTLIILVGALMAVLMTGTASAYLALGGGTGNWGVNGRIGSNTYYQNQQPSYPNTNQYQSTTPYYRSYNSYSNCCSYYSSNTATRSSGYSYDYAPRTSYYRSYSGSPSYTTYNYSRSYGGNDYASRASYYRGADGYKYLTS